MPVSVTSNLNKSKPWPSANRFTVDGQGNLLVWDDQDLIVIYAPGSWQVASKSNEQASPG